MVMSDKMNHSVMMHFCRGSGTPCRSSTLPILPICSVSPWLQPVLLQRRILWGAAEIINLFGHALSAAPESTQSLLRSFVRKIDFGGAQESAVSIGNPYLHVIIKNEGYCLFSTHHLLCRQLFQNYTICPTRF